MRNKDRGKKMKMRRKTEAKNTKTTKNKKINMAKQKNLENNINNIR